MKSSDLFPSLTPWSLWPWAAFLISRCPSTASGQHCLDLMSLEQKCFVHVCARQETVEYLKVRPEGQNHTPFSAPLLKTLLTTGWDPKFRATWTYLKDVFEKSLGKYTDKLISVLIEQREAHSFMNLCRWNSLLKSQKGYHFLHGKIWGGVNYHVSGIFKLGYPIITSPLSKRNQNRKLLRKMSQD